MGPTGRGDSRLDRTFAAIVCDWDGTLVPDRHSDARRLRRSIESLSIYGVEVVIVTGTHIANIDDQLGARPSGPGLLHVCVNRGSEVYAVDRAGPHLVVRRTAAAEENAALDRAAFAVVARLNALSLCARVVSQRLNRRKIDLIPDEVEWADPPKRLIDKLLDVVQTRLADHGLDLATVATMAYAEAETAGLANPKVTSDAKHIEIGLTDKADSAAWARGYLEALGIGAGLVLVGGDEFGTLGCLPGSDSLLVPVGYERATVVSVGVEPAGVPSEILHLQGGPERFLDVLANQLDRHRCRRVPDIDEDPAWVVTVDGSAAYQQRANESVLSLADGYFGTRGVVEEDGPGTMPAVLAAGIYTGAGATEHLLDSPLWTALSVPLDVVDDERTLDLRTGQILRRCHGAQRDFRSLRLVCASRPGIVALRAEGVAALSGSPLGRPRGRVLDSGRADSMTFVRVAAKPHGGVAAAGRQWRRTRDGLATLERLAAYVAHPNRTPSAAAARAQLDTATLAGFPRLLREQRSAWAQRWSDADVEIADDPELQRLMRFALFHTISSVADDGEAAVGARGLSGPGYAGHVFWDADVFVLPTLVAVAPKRARAMLEYRIRRLDAARAAATALGRRGARFPWESARDGTDVTPRTALIEGKTVPIFTGQQQEHIVADVAWAAWQYATWTGDDAFLTGAGYPLLTETARYWASRIRLDATGRGHIDHVIGPDEYHVDVNDDVFTNLMARWNLRTAAALVDRAGGAAEREESAEWSTLADSLVDGFDPRTGLYEQFAGYHDLEPLLVSSVARAPVAADLLLGQERTARSQIIKQADVVMVHHLLPDEPVAGSLRANLAFYAPRTAHGSSLSPAVHAALHARVGEVDEAVRWLRLAGRIDIDDVTAMTASGLHLAALGGMWQAVAFGFVGLHWDGVALRVDPKLPAEWSTLTLRCRIRSARVVVAVRSGDVTVTCERPLPIMAADGTVTTTTLAVLPRG